LTKFLKTADTEWYRQRIVGVAVCVLAAFVVLIFRVFHLQVIQGAELRRLSQNNCIRLRTIDPPRGLIFDRNGNLLVDNRPSFDLGFIVKDAKPVDETLKRLSYHLQKPYEDLAEKVAQATGVPSYSPVSLMQDIGRDAMAAVLVHQFELPGVAVQVNPLRHYIFPNSLAHLLGYLGQINMKELQSGRYPGAKQGDMIGKFGVEKTFEQHFNGKRGGQQVEVDASGQTIRVLKTVEAIPGRNVFLTIDQDLQKKAEDLLTGIAGSAVAMDPNTGDILAMASSPTFNQNDFINGISQSHWDELISNSFRPMQNKAIQGEFPPASTYKIITAIAGLEENIIDETTTVYCPGFYRFGNRVFRCWKRGGHGKVDVNKALAESCDVYFYQVGQKLGVDRLAWYAKACGLGIKTGIDLAHEAKGLVPTISWKRKRFGDPWHKGETLSVAIGQGYNLVTPIQLTVMISAISNGGFRYRPSIVKKIETADNIIVLSPKKEVVGKVPASAHTLEIVKRGLWAVVNTQKGTAKIARLPTVDMSGKTGTGQVKGRKKNDPFGEQELPDHLKAHAWFVAYAPSEKPEIAVAVIVQNGEHGSSAASPIARELVRDYLIGNHGQEPLIDRPMDQKKLNFVDSNTTDGDRS
jgi:penicillin-binding protein 2